MIPAPFDYHRPGTLQEAIGLLSRYGAEAKVLAGGMSLLPTLKLRLGSFGHLVDIGRIPGLEYIREEGGILCIGAGTRQCVLEQSEIIQSKYGVLADALPLIADPLVRNRGTLGGNLANGDPANDEPAIAIALGAQFVAQGPRGERTIAANRFYQALFTTALEPDEILTEVRVPIPPPRSGGAYQAQAQDRRFCRGGRGGAAHADRERKSGTRRNRAHQRRSDASRSGFRFKLSPGEDLG